MSDAYGPKPWHHVTVTSRWDAEEEEWDEPRVEFECTALYGGCHFYPACDCDWYGDHHLEENGPGHERVHHDECWLQGWFDNPEGMDYIGEGADIDWDGGIPRGMNRSGRIHAVGGYDTVEWEFVA